MTLSDKIISNILVHKNLNLDKTSLNEKFSKEDLKELVNKINDVLEKENLIYVLEDSNGKKEYMSKPGVKLNDIKKALKKHGVKNRVL